MFQSLGLTGGTLALLASGVTGVIFMISTIPAMPLIDKVGRKPMLIVGSVVMYVIPESFITVLACVRSHQESILGASAVARGNHVANNSRNRLLITPDTAVKGSY